jgi:hypothetical protein
VVKQPLLHYPFPSPHDVIWFSIFIQTKRTSIGTFKKIQLNLTSNIFPKEGRWSAYEIFQSTFIDRNLKDPSPSDRFQLALQVLSVHQLHYKNSFFTLLPHHHPYRLLKPKKRPRQKNRSSFFMIDINKKKVEKRCTLYNGNAKGEIYIFHENASTEKNV